MKKIVLAFDSFKGCITAEEACREAAMAVRESMNICSHGLSCDVETVECPLSDGGEGLVDCVERIMGTRLRRIHLKAHDPLMNIIDASYVIDETVVDSTGESHPIAYMEMAATSGLPLVAISKRNPLLTTTYGVGDMIVDAAKRGCKEIVIGIGGSATCDGGKGMIKCIRDYGYDLPSDKLPHITVASDVVNPLYGYQGAAYVFAPQKGATPEQVVVLDEQLRTFARETEDAGLATPELANYQGAGAAGGLGYGLMAYLKAELKSGIEIILDINGFNKIINDATLIITGEGKSDEQTLMGKVPHGVLKRAKQYDIPVWLLSGSIDDNGGALSRNFDLVKSINEGDNRALGVLMQSSVAKENLKECVCKLLRNTFK